PPRPLLPSPTRRSSDLLGAVAVIGRSAAGGDERLAPYDPRAELHPVALDGRSVGTESLAYPADHTMPQVCVDVATLVHQEPPRRSEEHTSELQSLTNLV